MAEEAEAPAAGPEATAGPKATGPAPAKPPPVPPLLERLMRIVATVLQAYGVQDKPKPKPKPKPETDPEPGAAAAGAGDAAAGPTSAEQAIARAVAEEDGNGERAWLRKHRDMVKESGLDRARERFALARAFYSKVPRGIKIAAFVIGSVLGLLLLPWCLWLCSSVLANKMLAARAVVLLAIMVSCLMALWLVKF